MSFSPSCVLALDCLRTGRKTSHFGPSPLRTPSVEYLIFSAIGEGLSLLLLSWCEADRSTPLEPPGFSAFSRLSGSISARLRCV